MKKREKAGIQEAAAIRHWLMEVDGEECPFHAFTGQTACANCEKFFPKLLEENCPCEQFNYSYVRKIARQLIKEEL